MTNQTIEKFEQELSPLFKQIDDISMHNQEKVLNAFTENRVGLMHMQGSSGYGYSDIAKDKLSQVFATTFSAESALVSPIFTCGTHALSATLFGILRPNDTMVSITGSPYDTLLACITGKGTGSLVEFGVKFVQVELTKDEQFDIPNIDKQLQTKPKLVLIQRSRGYSSRGPLSIASIESICKHIKSKSKETIIMVDNCYGEFIEEKEPIEVGADIMAGSLIKNVGGGICPTGAYVAGKEKLVRMVASRLTAPSLGNEVGSYNAPYTNFFQGFFMAPHMTAGCHKGSLLLGKTMEYLGYKSQPSTSKLQGDIVRIIEFEKPEPLIKFCQTVQAISPVDSFAKPMPWDMPGYDNQVIMASGSFIQGSSGELSADGPIRPPYLAYVQGGLTYEHIKILCKRLLEEK